MEPSGFFVAWAISTMTEPIHDLANLRWMAAQLILVLGLFEGVEALENGLGHTPAMGYNTWNDFQCEGVSARNISKVADKMVALGLPKLGYKYLIIDDCWAVGRTTAGVLIPDPEAFPDGMKSVADYVHAKAWENFGGKFGGFLLIFWSIPFVMFLLYLFWLAKGWQRENGDQGSRGVFSFKEKFIWPLDV